MKRFFLAVLFFAVLIALWEWAFRRKNLVAGLAAGAAASRGVS